MVNSVWKNFVENFAGFGVFSSESVETPVGKLRLEELRRESVQAWRFDASLRNPLRECVVNESENPLWLSDSLWAFADVRMVFVLGLTKGRRAGVFLWKTGHLRRCCGFGLLSCRGFG